MQNKVKVPQAVLDGIEAVRLSGKTNMLDCAAVIYWASQLDEHETVIWMHDNSKLYASVLFGDYEVA